MLSVCLFFQLKVKVGKLSEVELEVTMVRQVHSPKSRCCNQHLGQCTARMNFQTREKDIHEDHLPLALLSNLR